MLLLQLTNTKSIFFLDIDIPDFSGMEFQKATKKVLVSVFITAHSKHAVECFKLETLDFIVKPIKLDKFLQTMQRIEEFTEIKQKALLFESSIDGDTIYINEGH